MSAIETYLQYIASKVWARDVRTAIVNAIRQCYDDVHNPTLNTEAMQAAVQAKIDAGQMAGLTIGDGTLTGAKFADGTIPKAKLDPSITFDADATFDTTSTNAIQNKVVAGAISTLQADLGAQTISLDVLTSKLGFSVEINIKLGAGGINGTTGAVTTNDKRRIGFNASCVYLYSGTAIKTDGTLAVFKLVRYSAQTISSTNFISISAEFTDFMTVSEDGWYTLLIKKPEDTTITTEEHGIIEANTVLIAQKDGYFANIPFCTYSKGIDNTTIVCGKSNNTILVIVSGETGFYKVASSGSAVFKWYLMDEYGSKIDSTTEAKISKQVTLEKGHKLLVALQKSDAGNITMNDVPTLLESFSVSYIPDEIKRSYGYKGEKVMLDPTFDYHFLGKVAQYGNTSQSIQGIAQYEGKLVVLYDTGYYKIYQISPFTGTVLGSGLFESTASHLHCNACTFGAMHTDGDPFPLLYVTGGKDPVQGYCSVERIKSDYTNEHIQTISIDYSGFAQAGYIEEFVRPNFYVEGNYLYTFSAKYRTSGSDEAYDNVNRFVIHRYNLPDISTATVTLTADDVLDEFILPYNTFFMQGGTVHNGKLFELFGCGGATKGSKPAYNALRVYNLDGGYEIAQIDLSQVPASDKEIESAAVFGNDLLLNYVTGNVYILTF